MDEIFYGYCFPVPGEWHTPSVTLTTVEEIYRYTQLHGRGPFFREVRITDTGDNMVVQMVDGLYVFPEEWKELNKGALALEKSKTTDTQAENVHQSGKA